jgi:site-specific DNA recombinase
MSRLRCAAYVRVSTSMQNPLSPEDQLRKCQEFAAREGWEILGDQVYSDEALSGVGSDRPGLTRMMEAAASRNRPFDAVLVDDSSRLSRSLSDAMRIFERLNFAGVRVVAVSQGIDSKDEQADVLVTVHGLMDSLYVKELAKKTHRGMEGNLLRGFHTGGRCFGYEAVQSEGGKKLRVVEGEAVTVRRIFGMSADGAALKTIAKALNAERVPAPRPRSGRSAAGWCPTAIRAMLHNERYVGRVVWNRTKFVKVPGTNRRVARLRPESEWRTNILPDLQIVSDDLWERVQSRLCWLKESYKGNRPNGLLSRNAGSKYLFSGMFICADCGGRLAIITGSRKNDHPRWGCPRNYSRGTCSNSLRERNDRVESQILESLQGAVLQPEAMEYALAKFELELEQSLNSVSGEIDTRRKRMEALDVELGRLAEAVAIQGANTALMKAIAHRESERRAIEQMLWGSTSGSVKAALADVRDFALKQLHQIRAALHAQPEAARFELSKHVEGGIVMRPTLRGDAQFYTAEGEWSLLGKNEGRSPVTALRNLEMVAGVRFELTTFGL